MKSVPGRLLFKRAWESTLMVKGADYAADHRHEIARRPISNTHEKDDRSFRDKEDLTCMSHNQT